MSCPMCDKPSEKAFRPFCSKRCADLDLAKWFSGSYTIASQDPDDAEELENELRNTHEEKPH